MKLKVFNSIYSTYKAISFGPPSVLIGDDDGLLDLTELLEVAPHGLPLRLPGKTAHKNLSVGCIPEHPTCIAASTHVEMAVLGHKTAGSDQTSNATTRVGLVTVTN